MGMVSCISRSYPEDERGCKRMKEDDRGRQRMK